MRHVIIHKLYQQIIENMEGKEGFIDIVPPRTVLFKKLVETFSDVLFLEFVWLILVNVNHFNVNVVGDFKTKRNKFLSC